MLKKIRKRMMEAEIRRLEGVEVFVLWCLLTQATDPRLTTKEELEVLWAKFQIEAPDGVREVSMQEPSREDPAMRREFERYRYEMEARAREAEMRVQREKITPSIKWPRW